MAQIELIEGDITEQGVDAIVNAANSSLLGGGGVDGAIHRKGGPEILEACRELRRGQLGSGLPTGEAVATTAGRLAAKWVIHTVGPIYRGRAEDAQLLGRCHLRSLAIADELGARTLAFPAISTGVYGYPVDRAAEVAIESVRRAPSRLDTIRFVLFGPEAYRAFERVLARK